MPHAIQPEQAVARPAQEETKSPDAHESKASDSAQITEESPRAEADSKESNRAKWYEGRESSSLGDALAQASATDTQSSNAHDDTPADALNQLVDKAVQSADSQLSDSGSVIDNMSSTTLDSAAMNSAASALALWLARHPVSQRMVARHQQLDPIHPSQRQVRRQDLQHQDEVVHRTRQTVSALAPVLRKLARLARLVKEFTANES